jgi:hypothetical protein
MMRFEGNSVSVRKSTLSSVKRTLGFVIFSIACLFRLLFEDELHRSGSRMD